MSTVLDPLAGSKGAYKIPRVKAVLALLIFTPLVYSFDGDPYRAYEVMVVGMLYLMVALPDLFRLRVWQRAGTLSLLGICLLILVQPALVPAVSLVYNMKIATVLLFSFLPTLYLSNLNRPSRADELRYLSNALRIVFYLAASSLAISAVTGLGEVYTEGGSSQRRVFAWLGDGFAPVMVFFFYYHVFAKKPVGALISAACVILLMQAKMATGMAVLGYLTYLFIIARQRTRLLLLAATVAGVALLPPLVGRLTDGLHNFDYSLNNRLFSFNAGVEFFLSSPWFGVGANQTSTILKNSSTESEKELGEAGIPFYEVFQIHNAFLSTLAELGITGFTLLLVFCGVVVRRSWRNIRHVHLHASGQRGALISAFGLWLISFIVFYQTTGWFGFGNPQLAWLICFFTLMNFLSAHPAGRQGGRLSRA